MTVLSIQPPGGENCQKLAPKKRGRHNRYDKWILADRFELVTRVNHIQCALASLEFGIFLISYSLEHI